MGKTAEYKGCLKYASNTTPDNPDKFQYEAS